VFARHSSVLSGGGGGGEGDRCGRPTAGSPDQMDTPDRPRAGAGAGFEVLHLARSQGAAPLMLVPTGFRCSDGGF
jgi:hypothetical protein